MSNNVRDKIMYPASARGTYSTVYLNWESGDRVPVHARINNTSATKSKNTRKITKALYLYQYNSASCSRYLTMTLPVSFDSPSERTPKEKGTSAMPLAGMLALMSRSRAILKP